MLFKLLLIAGLVSTGLLLILMTTTTPSTAGAVGILAIFLFSYISILSFLTFALWLVSKLLSRIGHDLHIYKRAQNLTLKKAYYYSTVIALAPVIIISLQSVGGVSFYELGLVVIFVILGCIYVTRRAT